MKVKKLFALLMVLIVATLSFTVTSASASSLLDDTKKVNINVECGKKGYTYEAFLVATLDSTSSPSYETSYTSLVPEIKNAIKKGDTKSALAKLDELDTLPDTVKAYGGKFETSKATEYTFSELPQGIYYIKATKYPADVTAVQNSILALPYYGESGWTYDYKKVDLAEKVVQSPPTTHKIITNSTKNNENYTDVSLGDTVNFKITNTTTGSKQIRLTTYTVHDLMTKGLTLDGKSFSVYLADANGTKIEDISSNDYKVNVNAEEGKDTSFSVALTSAYLKNDNFYNDGVAQVVVEYSAKLNKYSVKGIAGNPNEDVKLEYGNKSTIDSVPGNKVYVYTYSLNVQKLDEEGNNLAGAEFALYSTEEDANNNKNVIASGVSDDNGKVVFSNSNKEEIALQSGNYFVKETKAPQDYNVYGKVIPIEIKVEYQDTFANDTYVANCPKDGYATCTVTDSKVTMPQTGGHVGYIYLAGAVLIILGGSVLFISKRKKAKVNNK